MAAGHGGGGRLKPSHAGSSQIPDEAGDLALPEDQNPDRSPQSVGNRTCSLGNGPGEVWLPL